MASALGEEVTVASEILSANVLQALWRLQESGRCGPSYVLILFRKERHHSSGQVLPLILSRSFRLLRSLTSSRPEAFCSHYVLA